SQLQCLQYCPRAIAHAKLGEDAGSMILHRAFYRAERVGDFPIAVAACDESEHVELAFCEAFGALLRFVSVGSNPVASARRVLGDGGPDQILSRGHTANRGRQQLE